jgi:hypothetical protein
MGWQFLVRCLDRDALSDRLMCCFLHDPHPTETDATQQAVLTDSLAHISSS